MNDLFSKTLNELRRKIRKGPIKLSAKGGSMEPTIYHGEKVIVEQKSIDNISINDIVLFVKNNRFIIHRIIYREEISEQISFLTRGDACDELDDWVLFQDEIIGVVIKETGI